MSSSLEINKCGEAFVFLMAGATPKRREWSGAAVRPGSKSRAKRSWGRSGSWESLLCVRVKTPAGSYRYSQDPRSCAFAAQRQRKQRKARTIRSDKQVEEKDRGSLSICIVALESRETIPREPVSSQGGYRLVELTSATRVGLRAGRSVYHERCQIVLSGCKAMMGARKGERSHHERNRMP